MTWSAKISDERIKKKIDYINEVLNDVSLSMSKKGGKYHLNLEYGSLDGVKTHITPFLTQRMMYYVVRAIENVLFASERYRNRGNVVYYVDIETFSGAKEAEVLLEDYKDRKQFDSLKALKSFFRHRYKNDKNVEVKNVGYNTFDVYFVVGNEQICEGVTISEIIKRRFLHAETLVEQFMQKAGDS